MKGFLLRIAVVVVLCAVIGGLCLSLDWIVAAFCGIVLIFLIVELCSYYKRSDRKIKLLLSALENGDSSVRFSTRRLHSVNSEVNTMLNSIAQILNEVRTDAARRDKYYEVILDFVDTGIIVLNSAGAVYQKNRAALQMLGLEVFTHLRQLKGHPELMEALAQCGSGDKLQVDMTLPRGKVTLSLRVSGMMLRGEPMRIVALSDINRALDEREITTWMKLTRVMTHEIMNSLTPITSLSETLMTMPDDNIDEIRQGMSTIYATSRDLIGFVASYRKLTHIPTPCPRLFNVKPFLERMIELARYQVEASNVRMTVTECADDLIVYADENLVAQVVTNLLKNAVEAMNHKGEVTMKAYSDSNESVNIEIANDGPRIDDEVAQQIFVPFFTTKPSGSGIGLSLSKQIMHLNGGTLTLRPYSSCSNTTFVLTFS